MPPKTDRLVLRRPDDWHVHVRDGQMLEAVLGFTARQFGRAIIMPNLIPPITHTTAALAYQQRILQALPKGTDFTPLMTAYLTDETDPQDLIAGYREGVFTAAKLYPAGATTNSEHGVTNITNIHTVLESMQKIGMPLLVHGEVTDAEIDIYDREAVYIERVLIPLRRHFPELKIVFEHITTKQAAQYVTGAGPGLAATITPHHLMINRSDMFRGGINPHLYCLPIAKREEHRQALRKAATGGSDRFFLGTDSAPHLIERKQSACGCAGVFNAPFALECYTQVFEEEGALENLEAFASLNGPKFYGLKPNADTITLKRAKTKVPEHIPAGRSRFIPFCAGQSLSWRLERNS